MTFSKILTFSNLRFKGTTGSAANQKATSDINGRVRFSSGNSFQWIAKGIDQWNIKLNNGYGYAHLQLNLLFLWKCDNYWSFCLLLLIFDQLNFLLNLFYYIHKNTTRRMIKEQRIQEWNHKSYPFWVIKLM